MPNETESKIRPPAPLLLKRDISRFLRYCDRSGVTHRPGKGQYQVVQCYVDGAGWKPIYKTKNEGESCYKCDVELGGIIDAFERYDMSLGRVSESDKLRAGNTKLLEVIMDLLGQYLCSVDGGDEIFPNQVSADERAIEVLEEAGLLRTIPGKGIFLNFKALEMRKKQDQEAQLKKK